MQRMFILFYYLCSIINDLLVWFFSVCMYIFLSVPFYPYVSSISLHFDLNVPWNSKLFLCKNICAQISFDPFLEQFKVLSLYSKSNVAPNFAHISEAFCFNLCTQLCMYIVQGTYLIIFKRYSSLYAKTKPRLGAPRVP